MKKILMIFMLSLVAASCGPRYVDYFPYHDDGSSKPAIALLPVIDKSGSQEPACQLITNVIRSEAMDRGELYLLSGEELGGGISQLRSVDFFASEASFASSFPQADFAVILELLDRKLSPYGASEAGANCTILSYPCEVLMTLRMRVKVIDLRPRCPRIVLQEIFTQSYFLPNSGCEDPDMLIRAYRRFAVSLHNRLDQIARSSY